MRFACLILVGVLATLVLGPAAQAGFVGIDDFQSYTAGDNVDGHNGWHAWTPGDVGYFTAVVDPSGPSSNKVLKSHNDGTFDEEHEYTAYNNSSSLTMPEGTTPATFFYRFMSTGPDAPHDQAWGLTSLATPHTWGAFRTRTALAGDGTLLLRNGAINDEPFVPDCGTWYSFWYVVHNVVNGVDNDTWDVYVQGGAYATQTQLADGFLFNTASGGDVEADSLRTFEMITDWGDMYFDDIYVDTAGENLSNPTSAIPEPATLALLALGGAVSLIRRRR